MNTIRPKKVVPVRISLPKAAKYYTQTRRFFQDSELCQMNVTIYLS